jgi:adenylate cyclase
MAANETGTLAALRALRAELVDPMVEAHHGRIVKLMGDGTLVEFASVVDAVSCAVEVQQALAIRNKEAPEARRLRLRIGINLGDVIVEGDDLYGDGVNIAARLEGIAEPCGICISDKVHREVRNHLNLRFADMGSRTLKNISDPVRLWKWVPGAPDNSARMGSANFIPNLPSKPSIVVLPFANNSRDKEQDYFCDGITEDITTALSRFSALFVIARNSALAYRSEKVDAGEASRALGVQYIVEGSVRRAGQRIRVSAQLIDAINKAQAWAETFDRVLEDVFELQDEITESIVGRVAPRVTKEEIARAKRRHPQDLSAYELALKAYDLALKSLRQARRELSDDALALAREALTIDQGSVLAHAAIVECRLNDVIFALAPVENLEIARNSANAIYEIDPNDHRAHLYLGRVAFIRKQHDNALMHLRRAVALNPNDARSLNYLAWVEGSSGLPDDCHRHAEQAIRLNPQDAFTTYLACWNMNQAAFVRGDYWEGIEFGRRAIAEMPTHAAIRGMLAACLAEAGELEEARTVIQQAIELGGNYISDRLAGNTYFKHREDHHRYIAALRKAAGLA